MSTYQIKTVQENGLILEYYVFGNGENHVVCMHGHGRHAKDFEFLTSPERTIISIHLFYHGNSYFPPERIEKDPVKSEEINSLFKQILAKENIDKFHLLAFSQGGRFSLCLFPFFYPQIETFTLISPDGMDNNSFYNWASRRRFFRRIFVQWEENPNRINLVSSISEKIGLMRPKVKSFVQDFSNDKERMHKASLTWRGFRNLKPSPEAIGKIIRETDIPFKIIMGNYDQVIRPKQAYRFEKKCGLNNVVFTINNGHNFFKSSSIQKFIHLLPFMK